MIKMYFYKMVANVMHWHMSRVQTIEDIFSIHLKTFTQATLCQTLATFCPLVTEIWSKMLFCKGHDLERSRS